MPFLPGFGHCQLLCDNEGTPLPYSVLLYLFKTCPNLQSFRLFPDTKIYIFNFLHLPPGTPLWGLEYSSLPFPVLDDCLLKTEQLLAHLAKQRPANCSTNGLHRDFKDKLPL